MRLRLAFVLVLSALPAAGAPLQVWYDGRRGAVAPEVLAHTELVTPVETAVGGKRLRYRAQAVGGVRVLGCGVDETVAADGTVVVSSARLCPTTVAADFTVDAEAAAAAARAAVEALGPADRIVASPPVAHYYQNGDALDAVWLVDVATAGPWRVWRVFVAGDTGEVLRSTKLSRDARGAVFPSPKSAAKGTPSVRSLPGLDGSGLLSGAACSIDDVTDYLALCPPDQLFCSPPLVTTCAAKAHRRAFMYSPTGQGGFDTCTASDRFDQVTGYFQLATMANYFVRAIGWTPGSGQLAGQLPMPVLANVPLLANAFFSPPATGAWPAYMAFGDEFDPPGVNDFLRDPTIPRHEFTHAVIYDTGSGLNDVFTCVQACAGNSGALNEAAADYFALASLGMKQTVVAPSAGTNLPIARDIRNALRFPCDLTGEPHDDGRIWSAFVLDVRELLGRGVDAAHFRALAGLPHSPTLEFADALNALVTELGTLDERHQVKLVAAATRRGLAGAFSHDRGNSSAVQYGPVVLPLTPSKRLTIRNTFPLPLGDAHFYYFQPPPGATAVSIDVGSHGDSEIPSELRYCGTVSVTGTLVPAQLNNVFLWLYDPTQPLLPFSLTPLDLDQHQLATAIPAKGPAHRRLRRFVLPPSPTGVYAVSVQGSGSYRVKLAFD